MFTVICLIIIAGLSLLAVFHPCFDDTLVQRMCLGCICLGALGTAYWVVVQNIDLPDPVEWLTWSGAAYAMETARKLYWLRRCP